MSYYDHYQYNGAISTVATIRDFFLLDMELKGKVVLQLSVQYQDSSKF